MNENAQLAEFAENLWKNYIKKKHDEANMDAVSFYRATVVSNDGNNKLTIQRPYDNEIQVSCTDDMAAATVGMQVLVIRFGLGKNNANHIVVARGNGNPIGHGGMAENGLPPGGTAGQLLVKDSSTDYDASWQTVQTQSRYIHEQATAASIWTINHNMDCYPSVTVVDTLNRVHIGTVQYLNTNTLTITFNAAFKGKAYLN